VAKARHSEKKREQDDSADIIFSLVEINFVEAVTRRSASFKPFVVPDVTPMFRVGESTGKVHFDTVILTSETGVQETVYVCRFPLKFQFIYVRKAAESESVEGEPEKNDIEAEISATLEVCYRVSGPVAPATDVLEHWAKQNVVLHAWPYWREFCHSSMARMNIPVVLMPLVRIEDLRVAAGASEG
jgi:hypothetical protein